MLGKDYVGQDCGIARALEVVGERWTLLIVRDALYGVRRFRDFQAHLDIPKAVLSDRLNGLVEHGILERRPDPHHAGRSLYELTEAGRELWPVLHAMVVWGDHHDLPNSRLFRHAACGTVLDDAAALPGVRDHPRGRGHRRRAAPGAGPAPRRSGRGGAAGSAPSARAARGRVARAFWSEVPGLRVRQSRTSHARRRARIDKLPRAMTEPTEAPAVRRPTPDMLVDVSRLDRGVLRRAPGSVQPCPGGVVRDLGSPRHLVHGDLHRVPHPRDQRGDRPVPDRAGDRRAAVPGARHARALRTGVPHRGRGARGPRRRGRGRLRGRLHADAGGLARDPDPQRARRRPRRRRRDHAVAQPARGRRVQVQPAPRRPGGHRRHAADPGRRERAAARGSARGRAPAVRGGDRPRAPPRLPHRVRRASCRRSSTSTRSRARESGSASTRSAARASPTGRRSPTATGSTSRSSTTGSIRRSRSCRSTTTARSGWTAPRRTRWRT